MRSPSLLLAALLALVPVACGDDGAEDGQPPPSTEEAVPAPPAALGEEDEVVVVGHRGAAGHHPDNSLEGFAAARDLGATWVELDVRLSSDREVVLSHDPETETGTVVADASADELSAEGVPTLDEALDVIDEHALGADVEIKSLPTEEGYDPSLAMVDATVAVLEERSPVGPVLVSSFDPLALDRVRELAGDDFDTVFITSGIGGAEDLAATMVDGGHDGLAVGDPGLPAEVVATFTAAGLPVWAWTVDDPAVARRLVDRGVTGIITDLPDVISETLAG